MKFFDIINVALSTIKSYIKLIATIIVAVAIVFLAYELGFFTDDGPKIEKTANVIEKVKKIGEFTSSCYYEEMVITRTKISESNDTRLGKLTKMITDEDIKDEIVIIANGKVRAGFDLSKLKDTDIKAQGDTLSLNLPKAEIFDIIINPSGYDIYVEDGNWSHEEVTEIEHEARVVLEKNARDYDLLSKAEKTGLSKLETLFKTFGFSQVYLTVSKE